jgi:hypothetical protein
VTLRGVVDSKAEHDAVFKIVKEHAGADKVIDEIEQK